MQDFWFPSLTNALLLYRMCTAGGSDADHFSAEATLPSHSDLRPSWLSASALSWGYRSLSGTLQGAPAVLLTTDKEENSHMSLIPKQSLPWLPDSSLVPGLIIMQLRSGPPLSKLVKYIILPLINIHFPLARLFPRPQAGLRSSKTYSGHPLQIRIQSIEQ